MLRELINFLLDAPALFWAGLLLLPLPTLFIVGVMLEELTNDLKAEWRAWAAFAHRFTKENRK